MYDMKKFLSILSESSTTSGSVATVSTAGNNAMRRPTDTIFAAENSEPKSSGPESAPKVDSPANFELWRNSAVIGKDQYGKHGRKKAVIDKTKMYPQIKESQYKQVHQAGIDALNRSRQSAERNAGLNEPDELVPNFGYNKKPEFGTWHFTYPDGTVVEKNGKPVLASSRQGAADILAIAKKHGVMIKQNDGAPPNLTEAGDADYEFPADMADYSPEDWEKFDAMVSGIGQSAKRHDEREAAKRNPESNGEQGMAEATGDSKFDSMMGDITSPEALDTREALALIRDLVYGGGASYEEALQQASVSFGINRAKLHALYKKQGVAEGSLNEFAITPDDGPDDGVQAGRWLVTYMVKNGITKEKIMVGKNANTVAKYFEFKYRRKPLSVVPYFDDMDLRGQLGLDEQGVAEATGDKKFDDMMKRVAKKPTQAQRKAERIRQQKEREAETKAHFANGGAFGPSPADKLSIRKNGVAEGSVLYGELPNKESFKVTYYDPKYDEKRTGIIKARNETAALDYCSGKGYDVLDIQRQGVAESKYPWLDSPKKKKDQEEKSKEQNMAEGSEITEEMIADRLKDELALFKSGTKAKSKDIGEKAPDREVQPKKPAKKDSE